MKLSTLSEARYTSGGFPKEFTIPVTLSGEEVRAQIVEHWCDGHEDLFEEMANDPAFVEAIRIALTKGVTRDALTMFNGRFPRGIYAMIEDENLEKYLLDRMRAAEKKLGIYG